MGGSSPYSVTAGSYGAANIRSAPALSATIVRTAPNGEVLQLVCQTTGDFAYGINIWNRLADNTFVHDSAVNTPVPNPLPVCGGSPPPPPVGITAVVVGYGYPLNIRADATTATAVIGTAADGSTIPLECWKRGMAIAGPNGTGSYDLWHRTLVNGVRGFVTDAYLNTPAYPAPDANQPRPGEPAC